MVHFSGSWGGTGGGFSFCPSLGDPSPGFIVGTGLGGEQPRAEAECWADDDEDRDEDCHGDNSTATNNQPPKATPNRRKQILHP